MSDGGEGCLIDVGRCLLLESDLWPGCLWFGCAGHFEFDVFGPFAVEFWVGGIEMGGGGEVFQSEVIAKNRRFGGVGCCVWCVGCLVVLGEHMREVIALFGGLLHEHIEGVGAPPAIAKLCFVFF